MKKVLIFNFSIALLVLPVIFLACSKQTTVSTNELKMVVGTYTDSGSQGIYSFDFNEVTGSFKLLDSCRIENPSYLTFSKNGDFIYAVSELHNDSAAVVALRFNRENGEMSILNSQFTHGFDPCYIATNGKVVVCANYGGSMSVFPLEKNGSLEPLSQIYEGSVGGPDSTRQEIPHVHCTEFSPDGRNLYVSDFSSDRLLVFDVINDGDSVMPLITDQDKQLAIEIDPESGPRHIIFNASGTYAYVIGEISGNITVMEKEGSGFKVKQVIDADPYDGRGSADIHLSPDGKFLYASNRLKNDGIAIFKVDPESGELTCQDYQLTGIHPRNFAITPNGNYLLCACRDSNMIFIYSIDKETGLLNDTGSRISLPKPVCVKFI